MTTQANDVRNGLLVHVSEVDESPTARLVRRLDELYDDLMEDKKTGVDHDEHHVKVGEARGLTYALQVLTCYNQPEIMQQLKIRWQNRQEKDG